MWKEKIKENILYKIKNLSLVLGSMFLWIFPIFLFLLASYLPKVLWKNLDFNSYIEFVKILIWPYTVLVILFFFKKVFTYLFFSMEEFNFFGAKGGLKNVNDVIREEVSRKFTEEKNEIERSSLLDGLNKEIEEKEKAISETENKADGNLVLAREIMNEWKKDSANRSDIIKKLEDRNKKLENILRNNLVHIEDNEKLDADDRKTSDSILEEDNVKR